MQRITRCGCTIPNYIYSEGTVWVLCKEWNGESNSEEDRACRISPLALLYTMIALLGAHRFLAFIEPLLTLHKHIAVREHLDDVAQESLRRERVPPPEHPLPRFQFAAALEEREFRRRLHLAEHLANRELLVQEEPFHLRCRDRHRARRDAGRLAVANEVHFAALGCGLFGRCGVRAGRGVGVDGLDIDTV